MDKCNQVLVCDDDAIFQLNIKRSLKGKYECRSAYNGDEALAIIKNYPIDIVLLDIQMRSLDEGLRFIPKMLEIDPDLNIVMSSSMMDFKTVREAMRLGAVDYIVKDFDSEELEHTLNRVFERRSLLQKQHQQNLETISAHQQHILVGESLQIQKLRKIIDKVKTSPSNIVITGETGTGKELVARQIRNKLSNNTLEPFLAIDSSTIQSSMAESMLFGHEKGAFTGADRTTKGIFEEANGGIVYFDEISNMPVNIQAKLLRVLQEKEVTRLGSSKVIKLNFRVVCATNQDLEQMAKKGEFKEDLLQRLNVIPIMLEPLRARKEDIPLLIQHFTRKQQGKLKFTEEAIEVLKSYSWPGNVRELGNLVAYLTTMTDGEEVDIADLPAKFREAARMTHIRSGKKASEKTSFYDKIAEFEKNLLAEEYQRFQGNVSQLAIALSVDRSHLYTKLKEFGIHSTRRGAAS